MTVIFDSDFNYKYNYNIYEFLFIFHNIKRKTRRNQKSC